MYMGGGFITVEEGDDVGMIEALEDLNLGRQVFLQFLVELRESDRFDGDVGAGLLAGSSASATRPQS